MRAGVVIIMALVVAALPTPQPVGAGADGALAIPAERDYLDSWVSPVGTTIVVTRARTGAPQSFLTGSDASGSVQFEIELIGEVNDLTFSPTGEIYATTRDPMAADPADSTALHHYSATGSHQQSLALDSAAPYVHSLEYGADGNVWVVTHTGVNSSVTVFDPDDLSVVATPIVNSSDIGQLEARAEGVAFVSYNGKVTLIGYGPSYALTEYPPITGLNPPSNQTQLSVAADLSVWYLIAQWDATRGGYPCDLSSFGVKRVSGASWELPASHVFGDSPSCEVADLETLPGGGAVLLGTDGTQLQVRWVGPDGSAAGGADYETGSFEDLALDQELTDMTVDGNSRVIVAASVPNGLCPSDRYATAPCGRVDLVEFGPTGAITVLGTRYGTAGDDEEDNDSARLLLRGLGEFQELKVSNGSVVVPVDFAATYAPPGIGAMSQGVWIAPADVSRRWWQDPAQQSQPEPGLMLTANPTRVHLGESVTFNYQCASAAEVVVIDEDDFAADASMGLPTSGNGQDFIQTATIHQIGTFRGLLRCGDETALSGPITVLGPLLEDYVALGDSYSTGEGVDPYFMDGHNADAFQDGRTTSRCHRSSRAYATYVAAPGETPVYSQASGNVDEGRGRGLHKYGSDLNVRVSGDRSWAFFACSSAEIPNVLPADGGGVVQYSATDYFGEIRTQLDNDEIGEDTDLITLTIGGNDVGFVPALIFCAQNPCNTPEQEAERRGAIESIEDDLVGLYRATRARAPYARILVLGYPQLFPESPLEQGCRSLIPWRGEMDYLRSLTAYLNSVIARAVTTADADIQFVDVQPDFSGHEVCGRSGEWINGIAYTAKAPRPSQRLRFDDESFHPNEFGQLAYALAVNRYLAAN